MKKIVGASTDSSKEAIKEKLRAQMAPFQAQLLRIEDAESKAEAVALVGRVFKYRNCYSCPDKESDYWWLYAKVIGMGDFHAKAFKFQTDKDGKIEIEQADYFSGSAAYTEITAKEFNAAWRKVQQRIARMVP